MTHRTSQIVFAAVLLLCAFTAHAQVNVAIAPDAHPQFLSGTGQPLAAGFLYTYLAGTSTLVPTYVDSTGTMQNADPIPLDSTGAPSNGSTQTGIWLANQAYKFCAYNSALVQQWCTDNITGYLGLLNTANVWTLQQTFSLPIVDSATDNQMVFGSPGNQTTVDFPPPAGNITVHGPTASGNLLINLSPAITTPTINSVAITGVPVQTLCSIAPVTVNASTTSQQVIQTCGLPSGVFNVLQKSLRFTFEVSTAPASSTANQVSWGIASSLSTGSGQVCNQTTASPGTCILQMVCTTLVTGSSGQLGCSGFSGGSLTASFTAYGVVTLNLLGTLQVGSLCAFGTASASNSCTGNQLIVEQLN
jgi:hypothetical protein